MDAMDAKSRPRPNVANAWTRLTRCALAHDRQTPQALADLLAADPGHARGWAVKGLAAMILARRELVTSAQEALGTARACLDATSTQDDRDYVTALAFAIAFDFRSAWSTLERVLARNPDDAMAMKLSHSLRFMRGDLQGMLRSSTRVMRRCSRDNPHYGYALGMHAFSLEEAGDYDTAERLGRTGVELTPDDAWGIHAVAHVHEMTGRARTGLKWLVANEPNVAHCNNFAGHVFWHRALFHLELGQPAAALALYDDAVRAEQTDDFRDIANAASLLARLELESVHVGTRWQELAAVAERRIGDGSLVFADLHYMLALTGAGRRRDARKLAGAMEAPGDAYRGDQNDLADETGAVVALGLAAFRAARYVNAAHLLEAARPSLQRIGGSHAQRDLFDLVLIESAVRGGLNTMAEKLLRERLAQRGENRFARERLARIDQALRRAGGGALVRLGVAAAASID